MDSNTNGSQMMNRNTFPWQRYHMLLSARKDDDLSETGRVELERLTAALADDEPRFNFYRCPLGYAVTDDRTEDYDSVVGYGRTKAEAIADLLDRTVDETAEAVA